MCFLENKEEIFVNISSDTYYKLDFCVILNTKYLILNKNSNPKNLFSSPLTLFTVKNIDVSLAKSFIFDIKLLGGSLVDQLIIN